MGAFESTEEYELSPPPPSHSTLFVVRNGRYEPQNLMPVLPRPDMLDFDGFVVRRGAGNGRLNPNPPEMKQASLMKNPVSVRRDSVRVERRDGRRASNVDETEANAAAAGAASASADGAASATSAGATASDDPEANAAAVEKEDQVVEGSFPVISFIFDALLPGHLTLHLLVTEVETPLKLDNPSEEAKPEGAEEVKPNPKVKGPSYIKLIPQVIPTGDDDQEKAEDVAFLLDEKPEAPAPGTLLDTFHIEKGLGQTYRSPPLDLAQYPEARLAFDPSRPRDIPIAVRLEAEVEPGEEASIQYTYISLTNSANAATSSSQGAEKSKAPAVWSSHLFSQKLQYGTQCFVLREVFGVTSKIADATEVEGGNTDCVICLSEPRDTAVLPCRHMCFCSYCAGIVRLQCDKCPVCRQKVQSLLQFKRDDGTASSDLAALSSPADGGTAGAPTSPFSAAASAHSSAGPPISLAPAASSSSPAMAAAAG